MCGICGIFNLKGQQNSSTDQIKDMTRILTHRGPDEWGIYLDDEVALGHARLSIIDLSRGTQPIYNEKKNLWIVYNGEIFNYPELRSDLEAKGHHFYTSTDTEVLLHLYEEKGTDCLGLLNGQFAFAIWDVSKKELFCARDRVGIRPFYYTMHNNIFIFASEIKSIFMNPQIPRIIDPLVLSEIFTFWTPLPGHTVFKNIHELPPGHFLLISKERSIIKRYWDIPFAEPDEQIDWPVSKICDHLQDLLVDAIRIRLRADVPVGCYLSGGLDSSVIATLVSKKFNNHVRTFGISFEDKSFDESNYQNIMVSFLNTAHTDLRATNSQIMNSLPETLWHCEQPVLRTAPVPLFLLSKMVNENGFKVVLTGEGADEVFAGYNIFRETKARIFWSKQPHSKFRGLLIRKLYPYIFKDTRSRSMVQSFFSRGIEKTEHPFFSHLIRWENTGRIKTYFSPHIRELLESYNVYENLEKILPFSFQRWDYLEKAQYLETTLFMSNYLLSCQGDRVAMAHSMEIRLPFLDYRILDFMGRVPAKQKIKVLNEKYILKQIFQNMLPTNIVNRSKQPYRAPIVQILQDKNDYLSNEALNKTGLFNPDKVKMLLNKLNKANNPNEINGMALIGILSTQILYDKFVANFSAESIPSLTTPFLVDRRKYLSN